MGTADRKPLHFVGSSLVDLRELPEDVQDAFGSALLDVQHGDFPTGARRFGEGLPREIMKLVEYHDGDTYRAAYAASFPLAVYVLHVFKKKSKSGIATPAPDKHVVEARFRTAETHYRQHYGRS
jgi:phage-related protein